MNVFISYCKISKMINYIIDMNTLIPKSYYCCIHFNNTMAKAVITADEYCVVHPISNLIDNAVKYTNQGDVTLKLYRNDEGLISLDVADTGIGISEEFISEIFRPFVQEDHGSTRRYEGIGLALAITQRLLTAIHATISVKSNKGKGTTFTIKLPL